MSTKFEYRFGSFSGLTLVQLQGSVTLDSGTVLFNPGTGGTDWDDNGLYSVDGSLNHGDVLYSQIKIDAFSASNHDFLWILATSGISFTGKVGARLVFVTPGVTARLIGYDDNIGNFGTEVGVSANTWYDLRLEVLTGGSAGLIRFSARLSNNVGNLNPTSSAWTVIGTSTTTYSNGSTVHMSANAKSLLIANATYHMDEWYWTNDGFISGNSTASSLLLDILD